MCGKQIKLILNEKQMSDQSRSDSRATLITELMPARGHLGEMNISGVRA